MLLFHAGDLQSTSEAEVDWWHAACRETPNPQASRASFCSARCGRSGAALAPCLGSQSPRRGVFSHVLVRSTAAGGPTTAPESFALFLPRPPIGPHLVTRDSVPQRCPPKCQRAAHVRDPGEPLEHLYSCVFSVLQGGAPSEAAQRPRFPERFLVPVGGLQGGGEKTRPRAPCSRSVFGAGFRRNKSTRDRA